MTNPSASDLSNGPSPFSELRNRIPLLRDVAYFQTGSLAPLVDSVRDATIGMLEAEGVSGLAGPDAYSMLHQQSENHRARLAGFLGVDSSEIGWTTNSTTAVRLAIDSVAWRPGDTLITTNREHISTRSLQDGLYDRRHVSTAILDASDGDDRLLSELEQTLIANRSPRLLLMSHVSCQDGRRLPVIEAAHLAHRQEVPILVDGAQSLGQFPVNVRDLECDMLIGSSHKWLLGPAGLGFLWVGSNGLIPFVSPFAMQPMKTADPANPRISTAVELGTSSMAQQAGLSSALDEIDRIGLTAIERHAAQLAEQLVDGLKSIPSVSTLSPREADQGSGIISFAIEGADHTRLTEIVKALWMFDRVMGKVQVEHPAIRISIAAFNTEDDVSRLVHALHRALCDSGA